MLDAAEPKDGDFVAYLAEIERRQLLGMQAPHRLVPPTGARGPMPTLASVSAPKQSDTPQVSGPRAIGGLLLAFFGLVFLFGGLSGEGIVLVPIGALLLWRAGKLLKALVRRTAASGAAGRS